jgi:glycogen(starch) synthase
MRILTISNFYPPHHVSGYAMLCSDVVEGLRARGHEVAVLTSTFGCGAPVRQDRVHRLLALESPLDYYRPIRGLFYPLANRRNVEYTQQVLEDFRPQIAFIWGLWNLSKRVAEEAERLCGPRVVYYLANPWPIEANRHVAYWALPTRRRWLGPAKKGCRQVARVVLRAEWTSPALRFEHAPCCSAALRDQLIGAGVGLKDAPVIYEGIDVASHVREGSRREMPAPGGTLLLVYVGLLVEHKGVHTAIEALSMLHSSTLKRVRLTILGSGHPEYEARLHALVAARGLEEHVTFVEPISRTELPRFLARHHVLILPSIWEEPLALIMQEALANGLVVVGSATGGTKEVIRTGENGLLFAAEDERELAAHVEALAASPDECRRLSEAGQRTATDKFTLERMVADLETYLLTTCAHPQSH